MSYRDPLSAAHARIAALEELLDSHRRSTDDAEGSEDDATARRSPALTEVRAELRIAQARTWELEGRVATLERELDEARAQLQAAEERVRESALRLQIEQMTQTSLKEARGQLVDAAFTQLRELHEEVQVHLAGDRSAVEAYYATRAQLLDTKLAERHALARELEQRLVAAREALERLSPADARERADAETAHAIAETKLEVVQTEIRSLQTERERVQAAEAALARHR